MRKTYLLLIGLLLFSSCEVSDCKECYEVTLSDNTSGVAEVYCRNKDIIQLEIQYDARRLREVRRISLGEYCGVSLSNLERQRDMKDREQICSGVSVLTVRRIECN